MFLASTAEVVSVTIVGVAGVVGTLAGAAWSARAQRKQKAADYQHELDVLDHGKATAEQRELRNEMLNTAAALAGDLTSAYYRVVQLSEHQAAETLDEIRRTLDSAASHLGRASLLFGPKTVTIQTAESAYQNVRTLLQWKRGLVEQRADVDTRAASQSYVNEDTLAAQNIAEFKRLAYIQAQAVTGAPTQEDG